MKRILQIVTLGALVCSCGVFARSDEPYTPRSAEVVDIGYGKAARGDLTSSVSSVDINENTVGTDPLFIVDGSAVSSIEWINPHDVKSIDVLKDAAATSIYGSRGANGVIIINLK